MEIKREYIVSFKYLMIVLAVFLVLYYGGKGISGLATLNPKSSEIINVEQEFDSNGNFEAMLGKEINLRGIKINGNYKGDGSFRVYLEIKNLSVLIMENEKEQTDKSGGLLTGFAVSDTAEESGDSATTTNSGENAGANTDTEDTTNSEDNIKSNTDTDNPTADSATTTNSGENAGTNTDTEDTTNSEDNIKSNTDTDNPTADSATTTNSGENAGTNTDTEDTTNSEDNIESNTDTENPTADSATTTNSGENTGANTDTEDTTKSEDNIDSNTDTNNDTGNLSLPEDNTTITATDTTNKSNATSEKNTETSKKTTGSNNNVSENSNETSGNYTEQNIGNITAKDNEGSNITSLTNVNVNNQSIVNESNNNISNKSNEIMNTTNVNETGVNTTSSNAESPVLSNDVHMFSNECLESCDLDLNTNKIKIRVELTGNISLYISSLTYLVPEADVEKAPILFKEIPDLTLTDKNTKRIQLLNYFQGDNLNFGVDASSKLIVKVINGTAYIQAKETFSGNKYLTFYAVNGYGSAESNQIRVNNIDTQKEQIINKIYQMFPAVKVLEAIKENNLYSFVLQMNETTLKVTGIKNVTDIKGITTGEIKQEITI